MRKTVLMAAMMVLASASAQAGDSRSLSVGGMSNDKPVAAAPAPRETYASNDANATVTDAAPVQSDKPRYSLPPAAIAEQAAPQAAPAAPAPAADAPRYTARPAPVEAAPAPTKPVKEEATYRPAQHRYADEGRSEPQTDNRDNVRKADRNDDHPRGRRGHWDADRVISELHRHGIYW